MTMDHGEDGIGGAWSKGHGSWVIAHGRIGILHGALCGSSALVAGYLSVTVCAKHDMQATAGMTFLRLAQAEAAMDRHMMSGGADGARLCQVVSVSGRAMSDGVSLLRAIGPCYS